MNDEANIEDVEQSETNEERYSDTSLTAEPPESLEAMGFDIGDADTAEGQARRAEEAHFEEVRGNSDKVGEGDSEDSILEQIEAEVEDLDPLPTPEEAQLGELCRTTEGGQFEGLSLVDDQTSDLIGVLEEETPKGATDQEVREAVEAVEEDI